MQVWSDPRVMPGIPIKGKERSRRSKMILKCNHIKSHFKEHVDLGGDVPGDFTTDSKHRNR